MIGIYEIINLVNNKSYVGSSSNIKNRWLKHKHELRKNKHPNKHLQSSWNKHGEDNFSFNILCLCNKEELVDKENYYISKNKPKYNVKQFSETRSGYKLSKSALVVKSISQTKISKEIDGNAFGERKGLCKSVLLYTICGDFIKKYNSQEDLIKDIGGSISYLSMVLSKRKLHYRGKILIRGNDTLTNKDIAKAQLFMPKKVIFPDGKKMTVKEAAELIGCREAYIRQWCLGYKKQPENLKIKYYGESKTI